MSLVMAMVALVLGFAAALLTVKRSSRWRPVCGSTLRCTSCRGNPTPREAASRLAVGTPQIQAVPRRGEAGRVAGDRW